MNDVNPLSSDKILYISFNFDNSYFSVGTESGFSVFQTNPPKLKFERNLVGGIGLVQMLNVSNLFCLAGGGSSPKYAPNKLLLWDDSKGKEIYEFRFNSNIQNCKIKKEKLFAVCEDEITVYDLVNSFKIISISTMENSIGLCSIAGNPDCYIFAWPDDIKGTVKVRDFKNIQIDEENNNDNLQEDDQFCKNFNKDIISIKAHDSFIAAITVNFDGTLLATASDKGTLIRIFSTIKGNMINELRRGSTEATIYDISFDITNEFLGATSSNGTTHLFVVDNNKIQGHKNNEKNVQNTTSYFGGIGKLMGIGFFQSEWSFCQLRTKYTEKTLVAINKELKTVVTVNYKGKFILANFETEPKSNNTSCKKQKELNIFYL